MIGLDGRELHHGDGPVRCKVCDGALIHQGPERTINEKASALLAYSSALSNDFYTGDVDTIFYKKKTRELRIVEHKKKGQQLTDGQKTYLPILSWLIALGVECLEGFDDRLFVTSGVYVCYFDFLLEWKDKKPVYSIDFESEPEVRQIMPIRDRLELGAPMRFRRVEELDLFLRGSITFQDFKAVAA